jgi:hypothetical protein
VIKPNPHLFEKGIIEGNAFREVILPCGIQAQTGTVGGLRKVGLLRNEVPAKKSTPYGR